MVADENDWSVAWSKMFAYIMKHNKLPTSFELLDLESLVPKKLHYMLRKMESLNSNQSVKAESGPGNANQAADGNSDRQRSSGTAGGKTGQRLGLFRGPTCPKFAPNCVC